MAQQTTPDLINSLPDPQAIRRRLVQLAAEANYLRSLLRLIERRPRALGRPLAAVLDGNRTAATR